MPKHIKIITQDDIGGVTRTNIYKTIADACFHTKHTHPTIRTSCNNNTTRVINNIIFKYSWTTENVTYFRYGALLKKKNVRNVHTTCVHCNITMTKALYKTHLLDPQHLAHVKYGPTGKFDPKARLIVDLLE